MQMSPRVWYSCIRLHVAVEWARIRAATTLIRESSGWKFRIRAPHSYIGENVTTPTVEDITESDIFTPEPPRESNGNEPSFKFIDADIGEFIKRPKTSIAREYEKKTEAALNSVMRFCAQNPRTVADAAAIIAYGDNFASAVGEVAEVNRRTRQMIDLILSPESPWLALAIAGIPMATQLLRNHETAVSNIPQTFKNRPSKEQRKAVKAEAKANRPKVAFKLFKREIKITLPFRLKFNFVMSQTVEPEALTKAVFSNEQVVKALKKRGIDVAYKM
jgi:hypothetical protein